MGGWCRRSKLVVVNKADAMRRFYLRLLRSGAVPSEAQQQAARELGLDPAELEEAAEAEAAAAKIAPKDAEKARLQARLRALEAARAARAAAPALPDAEAAKRRKLDLELNALCS